MISIHENTILSVPGVSIWDMLAGRRTGKAMAFALVVKSCGEIAVDFVMSCDTLEARIRYRHIATEANDGRKAVLVYEGEKS